MKRFRLVMDSGQTLESRDKDLRSFVFSTFRSPTEIAITKNSEDDWVLTRVSFDEWNELKVKKIGIVKIVELI